MKHHSKIIWSAKNCQLGSLIYVTIYNVAFRYLQNIFTAVALWAQLIATYHFSHYFPCIPFFNGIICFIMDDIITFEIWMTTHYKIYKRKKLSLVVYPLYHYVITTSIWDLSLTQPFSCYFLWKTGPCSTFSLFPTRIIIEALCNGCLFLRVVTQRKKYPVEKIANKDNRHFHFYTKPYCTHTIMFCVP